MSRKFSALVIGIGALAIFVVLIFRSLQISDAQEKRLVPDGKILVTTSFYPLAEFTKQVGQELVDVHNLTPAGSEPHDFDPSPQDLVLLENSKLFVYNGAGLELWLSKLGDEIKQKVPTVNASENIQLLQGSEEEEVIQTDPHVWMDPVLASQEVESIKKGLIQIDPTHASAYEQNAMKYQTELSNLDTEFRTVLTECRTRDIVTSHNAFQYLGKRYNLNILSISGLSPDEEPSPKKLAEVTQFVKKNNVKYIFFESLVSPKLSHTIAEETGAKTISFNPLEGLTMNELAEGKKYLTIQRENLVALRTALECK